MMKLKQRTQANCAHTTPKPGVNTISAVPLMYPPPTQVAVDNKQNNLKFKFF